MTIVTTRPPERHIEDYSNCSTEAHRELLASRFAVSEGGCWTWLLRPDGSGYGVLVHKGTGWLAHRFTYETCVERIPDGLSLDHLCRNRICVNPDHLEPVTYEENWRRGNGAGARWRNLPSPIPDIERRPYRPRAVTDADDPRHGTTTGYASLKCRCERCRAAHAAYARELRQRRAGER